MARERRLADYDRKRSFDRTPEPRGSRGRRSEGGAGARFVVQEHHARRLHWDLRLERDGVLVSWALPRGLPDDPSRNRLAVRTEDHPLEYLTFHGEIPSGEYGAGSMTIWDEGRYEAEKFTDREVIVRLEGNRARGRYAIFRTHDNDWLIHRMDPPEPDREPFPAELEPMLATLSELPGDDAHWGFEIKWDGVRALAYGQPGQLRLVSRNLRDITPQYPEIRELERALGARQVVLDGELVALDDQGRPSFQRLQTRMHVTAASEVRRRQRDVPVTYMIFDLLFLDGRSLLDLPYEQRRQELDRMGLTGPRWRTPAYQRGDGAALLAASRDQRLEGIVAKRLASTYHPGRRTRDWLKIKNLQRQDVVIGGWVPGEGRRAGELGALLVGVYDDGGNQLRFAGKVGTGFGAADLRRLGGLLEPLRTEESPFTGRQPQRDAVFVQPQLVCEVDFAEWTRTGTLRHPSYQGLRTDLPPTAVVREETVAAPTTEAGHSDGRGGGPEGGVGLDEETVEVDGQELTFTGLGTVLYPVTGTTKRDVVDYYRAVAPALLPHLKGRPLRLERYPDGGTGRHVRETQGPPWRPDGEVAASVGSAQTPRDVGFCLVDDLPSLLWSANRAVLEIHSLLARADRLDRPTLVAFELVPKDGVGTPECARVALYLRELLDDLGLRTVVTSSGSRGLLLHVPLNTAVGYDESGPFAHAVARLVENHHPELAVSTSRAGQRGRVWVDWSRNAPEGSVLVPFSLSAGSRPGVAAPVRWEEVAAVAEERERPETLALDPDRVLDELTERAKLVRPLLRLRQRLPSFGG